MRANGNEWVHKDVRVVLAQAYGYCWGVERAVQMAYEARKQYPERKLHITNEIIHNPAVNQVGSHTDLRNPPHCAVSSVCSLKRDKAMGSEQRLPLQPTITYILDGRRPSRFYRLACLRALTLSGGVAPLRYPC